MAGTNLGKAYVQIVPSTEGMKGALESALNKEVGGVGDKLGGDVGGGILGGIAGILNGKGKSVLEGGLSSLLTEAGLSSAAAGPVAAIVTTVGAGLVKAGAKAAEVTAQVVKGVAEGGAAVAGLGISGAAALGKSAVESFSTFEQVSDGARRIFDEVDYNTMAADAFNAYKDLNLSANEYFSTIVDAGAGFAASMGDKKGYETARKGMIAVSDYAAATGKDISLLNQKFNLISRSAASYQTIADQFNGLIPQTSADFLEQAQAAGLLSSEYEKLTAVPVAEYQAALVAMMQKGTDTMNITGKTAEESLSTITGSLAMTKAAWQNLLVGLADPDVDLKQQTDNLLESILGAFNEDGEREGGLVKNIVPRFKEAVSQIGPALKEALPEISGAVNELLQDDELINNLLDGAGAILDSAFENLPMLLDSALDRAPDLMTKFGDWIGEKLPQLSDSLLSTLAEHSEEISSAFTEMISQIFSGIELSTESFEQYAKPIFEPLIKNVILALPEWIKSAFASAGNIWSAIWGVIVDEISANCDWIGSFWELISGMLFHNNDNYNGPITTGALGSGMVTTSPLGSGSGIQSPLGSGLLGDGGLPEVTEESDKTTAALTETDGAVKTLNTSFGEAGGATQIAAQNLGLTAGAAQGANGQLSQTAAVTETVSGDMGNLSGSTGAANAALGETGAVTATATGAMGDLSGSTGAANAALGETQAAGDSAKAGLDNAGAGGSAAATGLQAAGTASVTLVDALAVVGQSADSMMGAFNNLPMRFGAMWTQCRNVFSNAPAFFATVGTSSATAFVTPWNAVPGQIKGVYEQIKGTFTAAAAEAFGWGYDMSANYAAGINDGAWLVEEAVGSLTSMINANLGFSEPEEGPLSDFHTYAPDMMELFAKGVADNEAMVRDQIRRSFDFGEYMNQTGTVSAAADGGGENDMERIIDLLTGILEALGRGGGVGMNDLLDAIDRDLGRRAALRGRR